MAKSALRNTSGKVLNSTEKQAISKLKKVHEPMLKELERWKEQREKLENTLFDQIHRIGKFLEDPSSIQETLTSLTGQFPKAKARTSNRKSTSAKSTAKSKPSSKTKKSR